MNYIIYMFLVIILNTFLSILKRGHFYLQFALIFQNYFNLHFHADIG